eukprot:3536374-Pleurochrysis_carterae.AAC.1
MAVLCSGGRGGGVGAVGALRVTALLLVSFAACGYSYVLPSRAIHTRRSVPASGGVPIRSFRAPSTPIYAKLEQSPAPTIGAYSELLSV